MNTALLKPALLATMIVLPACTLFPQQEAPQLMDLAPPSSLTTFDTSSEASLRVETPLATAPFDSNRLLIKPTPYEFQALPDTRWRATMPVLLREYLVQYFRQSGGFSSVVTDTNPATSELRLVSELSGFHAAAEAGGNTVVVHLYSELMDNQARTSLCVRDHRIQVPAASTRLPDLMTAFSTGAQALAEQTLTWAYHCRARD